MAKDSAEARLFDDAPAITRVTRDAAAAPWASVFVGKRRVARVPFARAESLGVAAGAAWTPQLAANVALAASVLKARLKAVALLKVRARSEAEMRERLLRSFDAAAVDAAIEELRRQRLLDDAALASHLAENDLARGRSPRLVNERLVAKGLLRIEEHAPAKPHLSGGEHARAIAAARNRLAKLPESLSAPARHLRLLSALARLGYEEDVARAAAAEVLGADEEGMD